MAGILAHVNADEVTLVAATAKTALQIVAAANHRVLVRRLRVMGKGTNPTGSPIKVRILRQTTAGSGGGAVTPAKHAPGDDETLATTALKAITTEPTAGDVLYTGEVHPQNGWVEDFGLEPLIIPGGTKLGVELTSAQALSVAVSALVEE